MFGALIRDNFVTLGDAKPKDIALVASNSVSAVLNGIHTSFIFTSERLLNSASFGPCNLHTGRQYSLMSEKTKIELIILFLNQHANMLISSTCILIPKELIKL